MMGLGVRDSGGFEVWGYMSLVMPLTVLLCALKDDDEWNGF